MPRRRFSPKELDKRAIGEAFNRLYDPPPFVPPKKCPVCRRGEILDDPTGLFCSRRYAPKACRFETGVEPTRAEWDAQVARFR